MTRFFLTWVVCWLVNLLVGTGVSLAVFRHVDLRVETFAATIVVPLVQALALSRATTRLDVRAGAARLRRAAAHPLAQLVLAGDVLVLVAVVAASAYPAIDAARLAPAWLGAKLVVAGVAGVQAWRTERPGRAWLACAVAWLLLGVEAWWPWSDAVARLALRPVGTVVRWVAIDVPVFAGLVWLTLVAADSWARAASDVRAWLHAALGAFVPVATIACIGFFLRPFLVQPWAGAVGLLLSASGSCLAVAALQAATIRE